MKMDCQSLNTSVSGIEDDHHDPGKMFIGGLSWQTTSEGLREHFGKFGEINECMVMKDPVTKRSRGFGFVIYRDPGAVDKVLANGPHQLDSKVVDPKVAFPRQSGSVVTQPKMVTRTKKMFVGGLSASTTIDDVKSYFEQYGKIEDAMLMFDKITQRHRGFAFVTFECEAVVDKVCEIHFHEINNKMVECKKAQPKEVMMPSQVNKGFVPLNIPAAFAAYGRGYPLASLPGYYIPGLPSYSILPSSSAMAGSDRLSASYYPDYGSGASASQMVATLMARQSDPSQLALGAPTLLTDQYLAQHRTLQGMSPTASRNILSMSDQGPDFVVTSSGNMLPLLNSNYLSSSTLNAASRALTHVGELYSPSSDAAAAALGYVQTGSPQPSGYALNIGGTLVPFQNGFH
jgi:RNA-binding protein Musashi